jgi:hypothetical protein
MPTAPKPSAEDRKVPDVIADPSLSRQAQFSTYKENTDVPDDVNPKPGRQVIQELGKPSK